jgi:hypothetical protein
LRNPNFSGEIWAERISFMWREMILEMILYIELQREIFLNCVKVVDMSVFGIRTMKIIFKGARICAEVLEYFTTLRRSSPKKTMHTKNNSMGNTYSPGILSLLKLWRTLLMSSIVIPVINWSFPSWSMNLGKCEATWRMVFIVSLDFDLKLFWKHRDPLTTIS